MNILKINSTGNDVYLLQSTLLKLKFYTGKIDGIFGENTENAVMNFQKRHNLVPDGIVGQNTISALLPYINGYTTYTIMQGDTFFSIANKFYTSVNSIIFANPSVDYSNLSVGQQIIVPFGNSIIPTNIPYTSDVLSLNVKALKTIYPFLRISHIGYSVLGKPIQALSFGTGKNEYFYNASIHANEWITSPVLMKFLETLCSAYVNNTTIHEIDIRNLYKDITLYIVPLLNPDGVDLVTDNLNKNSNAYLNAKLISSRFPEIPFPDGWKANILGVDLNLQFPAGWQNAREIKYSLGFSKPAPKDFVGFAPLSTPESRAIYRFTLSHDFRLILTYHTQGQVIYWQYQNYAPKDSIDIANKFAKLSSYEVADVPYNSSFAGYKDWFIYNYRKPGFTIEAGLGESPLPVSQFDEIYKDNFGILINGILQ